MITSCNLVHFVLYEEVDQGHQRAKEQTCQDFSIFDCGRIWWTESKTSNVATRYEIMKISCQSWSSVDVTYVHPPHVIVLKRPVPATIFGKVEFGFAVRMYQRKTRANRGPEVIAMNIWNTERSG
jgi:hypothetical protein